MAAELPAWLSGDIQLGGGDARPVVCKHPGLAEDRARKQEELLQATEQELDKVVESVAAVRLT